MAWSNGLAHWGLAARALHWGIALLVLIEVVAGFVMSRTFGMKAAGPALWHYWMSNIHHTGGLLILLLALLRAGWRMAGPVPTPAATMTAPVRRIAGMTHWLLYALLLLIPLSGWAALSALADSAAFGPTMLWFFGTNGFDGIIPRIVAPVPWNSADLLSFGFFARGHVWLLIAGATLLVLHVLAALRHHFVLKDATLRRMLRG